MSGCNTCMDKDIHHEDIIIKLNIHGCTRSEQYTASRVIKNYATKYNTKGSISFSNWDIYFQSIIKYLRNTGEKNKTVRSIYSKYKLESKVQNGCV